MKKVIISMLILSGLGLIGCSGGTASTMADTSSISDKSNEDTFDKAREVAETIEDENVQVAFEEYIEKSEELINTVETINIENKIMDVLNGAKSYYREQLSSYVSQQVGRKVELNLANNRAYVLDKSEDVFTDNADYSYNGEIRYQALYNNGAKYFWYSIMVSIDVVDNEPVAITLVADNAKKSIVEETIWDFERIYKKGMRKTINLDNWTESNTINADSNYNGKYFKFQNEEEFTLVMPIENIPKNEIQDCINEFYAIKGYKFKEEPYKSRYKAYNGYIENIDDIEMNDAERKLIDKLVSIKNQ